MVFRMEIKVEAQEFTDARGEITGARDSVLVSRLQMLLFVECLDAVVMGKADQFRQEKIDRNRGKDIDPMGKRAPKPKDQRPRATDNYRREGRPPRLFEVSLLFGEKINQGVDPKVNQLGKGHYGYPESPREPEEEIHRSGGVANLVNPLEHRILLGIARPIMVLKMPQSIGRKRHDRENTAGMA